MHPKLAPTARHRLSYGLYPGFLPPASFRVSAKSSRTLKDLTLVIV
jgi:hypothetical protein